MLRAEGCCFDNLPHVYARTSIRELRLRLEGGFPVLKDLRNDQSEILRVRPDDGSTGTRKDKPQGLDVHACGYDLFTAFEGGS